jgi:A/G-specific adenine glycosylase
MAGPSVPAAEEQQPSRRAQARVALIAWYAPRRRSFPWRRPAGRAGRFPDPYAVMVSEFMLQQTQAARVVPVFEAFIARFPDIGALASASRAEVLRAWGRLGYPRRAVALHRAAIEIEQRLGGDVPRDPEVLRSLPGVGDYTSTAIASIAFGAPVAAVDTNVRRVWARVDFGADPEAIPARDLVDAADAWLDAQRPDAWNQALMDLGRDVCRPAPRCERCPLRPWCRFEAGAPTARRSTTRRQPPYEGSMRQVRGAVLHLLQERAPRTLGGMARTLEAPVSRVADAVRGLHGDGVVAASPAALEGRDRGRVALPD